MDPEYLKGCLNQCPNCRALNTLHRDLVVFSVGDADDQNHRTGNLVCSKCGKHCDVRDLNNT
jgi:hypothetical protein